MFGSLGVPEILFILVLALLVFGPRRLPELGRTIGRAMGEFRRATTDLRRTLNNELALEDESPRRPVPPRGPERSPAERKHVAGGEPGPGAEAALVAAPVVRPAAGTAPRGADAAEAEAEAAFRPSGTESSGGESSVPERTGPGPAAPEPNAPSAEPGGRSGSHRPRQGSGRATKASDGANGSGGGEASAEGPPIPVPADER